MLAVSGAANATRVSIRIQTMALNGRIALGSNPKLTGNAETVEVDLGRNGPRDHPWELLAPRSYGGLRN